ncbi:MAG: tyrosine-type recombinase/integrase [Bacteroidales bacterium]|nr:tyrosine-type recombinase/integrase [Bacteroidales bacterium]MBN2757418.1 tyrosine-type recombinase/integrase [Bacteroidales bacterium]
MKLTKKIIVEPTSHMNENRLKLLFDFDKDLIDIVKTIPNRKWSKTMNCWHIPDTESINTLNSKFSPSITFVEIIYKQNTQHNLNAVILINKVENRIQLSLNDDEEIKDKLASIDKHYRLANHPKWFFSGSNENYLQIIEILKTHNYKYRIEYKKDKDEEQENPLVKHYVQAMMMRNNSKSTIDTYTFFFKQFVADFKKHEISKLEYAEINSYIQKQIRTRQLSEQQQLQLISAIKYYYEKIQGKEKMYFYLKKQNQIIDSNIYIPIDEIIPIIEEIKKTKEKLLIIFHYSLGLGFDKISELTLEKSKTVLKRNLNSKTFILQLVKEYYLKCKPTLYFFEYENDTKYPDKEIEASIYRIVGKYQLIDIYKKEYKFICMKAEMQESSTKNYLSYFLTFLKEFNFVHPLTISNEQIRLFLLKLNKDTYSKNTVSQYINCIKLYYVRTGRREIEDKFIFRPKKENKLPEILSLDEIKSLLSTISNLKHHCILALTYSGGLRRSETLNLEIQDIDMSRNEIRIRNGKGKKDRITLLSESLKKMLVLYIKEYKPQKYLFEGSTGGKYSASSMDKILKKALKKANINKNISLHSLRHSFATHLLEQGTDIRFIQELLGHSNIKTTVLYTKIAQTAVRKIKNPLDNILKNKKNDTPP